MRRPADDPAAADVARPDRKAAGTPRRLHDGLEVLRAMRPVRVHLDEQLRSLCEPDPKCIFIRAADAELAFPVQDPHTWIGLRETVRQLPGAIG